MLLLEIPKPDTPPIVVLESGLEFGSAAEAVKDIDPELASQLGSIAVLVHEKGISPTSTRLEGAASEKVITGLSNLATHNTFASLILEDAERVDYSAVPADEWPEDLVAYIDALEGGPHSGPIPSARAKDPGDTGYIVMEAEIKNADIEDAQKRRDAPFHKALREAKLVPAVIE